MLARPGRGLFLLALVPALIAVPASAKVEKSACRVPHGAKVIVRGASSVVYSTKAETSAGRVHRFFGCLTHPGVRTHLADIYAGDDVRFTHFTLAGRYLVWVRTTDARPGAVHVTIPSFDLRKRRAHGTTEVDNEDAGATYGGEVPSLVLARDGDFAYVAKTWQFGAGSPTRQVQVRARDTSGERVLDSGGGIDPASLSRTGSTVSWTKDGVRRSAGLY
jgi:hypothetical protein